MGEQEDSMLKSAKLAAENMNIFVEMLAGTVKSNSSSLDTLKLGLKSAKSHMNKEQYAEVMEIYKKYVKVIKSENKALNLASKAFSELSDAFINDVQLKNEIMSKIREQELKPRSKK